MTKRPSTGTKLRIRIPKGFWAAMGLILVSLLPYLNELLTLRTHQGAEWSYLLGLERILPDANTAVLGYSGYRMFLYILFIFCFTTLGWGVWLYVAKKATYRNAIWVPLILGIYQTVIILGGWRTTSMNNWEVKIGLTFLLALILFIWNLKNTTLNIGMFGKGLLIVLAATLPFFHDVITDKSTASTRGWVPHLGIENTLKNKDGLVLGFSSYRAFVYFLLLHVGAHLSWLGAFVDYGHYRKRIRPFLLAPVAISFFSLGLFLLNLEDTPFGAPDTKFYITIGLSLLLVWNFFFNDKTGRIEQFQTKNM